MGILIGNISRVSEIKCMRDFPASLKLMYSASDEERATEVCFCDHQIIRLPDMNMVSPEYDLLSNLLLAQSESQYE